MSDLLQTDSNDVAVVNNALVLTDGLQQVKQELMQRLQTISGEWFLDTSVGLPYLTDMTQKGMKLSTAAQYFRNEINACPGVLAINKLELSLDNTTRRLSVAIEVQGETGEISLEVTV